MTVICLYFEKGVLNDLGQNLSSLSAGYPTTWSDSENGKEHPITREQLLSLGTFFPSSSKGGFLYGSGAKYSISLGTAASKIFIECEADSIAESIFRALINSEIEYGYACQFDERKQRNQVSATKNYGQENIWVGRNFKTQLPGLYWLNAIPSKALARYDISRVDIGKIAT
jgi:hypothetical protein